MTLSLRLLTILYVSMLTSCSNSAPVDANSIVVVKTNQHPFLVDHNRELRTVDKEGNTIDDAELYTDSGEGCNSYLFDTDQTYTVIDCNGHWYLINKKTGKIDNNTWQWQKELPASYIGTFKRAAGQIEYSLTKENNITLEQVYQVKDPR